MHYSLLHISGCPPGLDQVRGPQFSSEFDILLIGQPKVSPLFPVLLQPCFPQGISPMKWPPKQLRLGLTH